MITPTELGLWLLAEPVGRSKSMIDLIESDDMVIVADGETFGMKRRHNDVVSHYETGSALPLLDWTTAKRVLNDLGSAVAVVGADGVFEKVGHCVYSSRMTGHKPSTRLDRWQTPTRAVSQQMKSPGLGRKRPGL